MTYGSERYSINIEDDNSIQYYHRFRNPAIDYKFVVSVVNREY